MKSERSEASFKVAEEGKRENRMDESSLHELDEDYLGVIPLFRRAEAREETIQRVRAIGRVKPGEER